MLTYNGEDPALKPFIVAQCLLKRYPKCNLNETQATDFSQNLAIFDIAD
jgi:hypothetical protein